MKVKKLDRSKAKVDRELAAVREVVEIVQGLDPVWALPPDKLDEYCAHDPVAQAIRCELALLLREIIL